MFVKELRFVEREGRKVLQQKLSEFCGDAAGAICGETPPTDWQDVPCAKEQPHD